jgi:HD superfamily phosphohydrolase
LGFTFYIYSGATHTRFSHALGVLHVMDRLLKAIGKGVSDEQLFNPSFNSKEKEFHQTMRIAALLHDIGTFPFSHTIELAYINHWKKQKSLGANHQMANHENLGSHIIRKTDFDGGLTKVLKEHGIDIDELSSIIAGKSSNTLANQLLHSDVDADRMDYLLRDAHFTGIKYGQYDLEFLLRNATTAKVKDKEVLCFKESAQNVVEYFLISRFYWYSQIIEDGTGYKFDLLAAKIYEYFLENEMVHSFDTLIKKVSQDPDQYFTFNDGYFQTRLHQFLETKDQNKQIHELCQMLAYRKPPKQIKIDPIEPTLIRGEAHRKEVITRIKEAGEWLENSLKEIDPTAWLILDIPKRDIIFTKDHELVKVDSKGKSAMLVRDSAKILDRNNEPKLLIDVSNSLFQVISQYRNFIPRIYVSDSTHDKLEKKGVLKAFKSKFSKARKAG